MERKERSPVYRKQMRCCVPLEKIERVAVVAFFFFVFVSADAFSSRRGKGKATKIHDIQVFSARACLFAIYAHKLLIRTRDIGQQQVLV